MRTPLYVCVMVCIVGVYSFTAVQLKALHAACEHELDLSRGFHSNNTGFIHCNGCIPMGAIRQEYHMHLFLALGQAC